MRKTFVTIIQIKWYWWTSKCPFLYCAYIFFMVLWPHECYPKIQWVDQLICNLLSILGSWVLFWVGISIEELKCSCHECAMWNGWLGKLASWVGTCWYMFTSEWMNEWMGPQLAPSTLSLFWDITMFKHTSVFTVFILYTLTVHTVQSIKVKNVFRNT